MGMMQLKIGSVWNIMLAYIYDCCMEVYFYFEFLEDQAVCYFFGEFIEICYFWLKNEEVVIFLFWFIYVGLGIINYIFIWGMAGENFDYGDMDKCVIIDLK